MCDQGFVELSTGLITITQGAWVGMIGSRGMLSYDPWVLLDKA